MYAIRALLGKAKENYIQCYTPIIIMSKKN